jgi:hypothetical protein
MSVSQYKPQLLTKSSSSLRLRNALVALLVLVATFLGGYYGHIKMQDYRTDQAHKSAKSYVQTVLKGDLDKAYDMSASSLKKEQSKEDFVKTLKDLKTGKPTFSDEETSITKSGITYAVVVDNLPPNANGATDGVFYLNLVNELGWKVRSIDVR